MEIEDMYLEFEKAKKIVKEQQLLAKEYKDQMIEYLLEKGVDRYVINGLEGLVELNISYPEKEVLNKKTLAESLNVKQKDLSKPQYMIELALSGRLTPELLSEHTFTEERMQFSVKENPTLDEDEDE